jgi:5'-nucleotidase
MPLVCVQRSYRYRRAALLCGLVCALCLGTAAAREVAVRVIAFNDFHGHLEPGENSLMVPHPDGSGRRVALRAGGAAHLATVVRRLRSEQPNSIVVAAGDLTGASPLASALFRDEPTVEFMNAIRLDINALGNHEFDHGVGELRRLLDGGCAEQPRGATQSCARGPRSFAGARYAAIAANVVDANERPLVAPSVVRSVEGVKIAFIGAVTRTTPGIVMPSGIRGWRFLDEARAINREVQALRAQGVRAFIAVMHEGSESDADFDSCDGVRGALARIAAALDPDVAIVVSGHTHRAYNCRHGGRVLTQAGSYGRVVTLIDFKLDSRTGQIRRDGIAAHNLPVINSAAEDPALNAAYPASVADPEIAAMVASWSERAAPIAERPVGRIAARFERRADPGGDHAAGRLVADAHLWATRSPDIGGAQIAFTNPGGVRTDLRSRQPDGAVSYGDLFAMQPFGNALVTLELTGAQVRALLESQWNRRDPQRVRFLQPSRGFSYAWSDARPYGERVSPESMRLDGQRIDPQRRYRVTVNDYLANGGDGFRILREGRARRGGPLDVDALAAYVGEHSKQAPLAPDLTARIEAGGATAMR